MRTFRIFDRARVLIVGATILFSLSAFSATVGAQQDEKLILEKSWVDWYYVQGRACYENQLYVQAHEYLSVYYSILFGYGILPRFPDFQVEINQIMAFLREYLNNAVTERAGLAADLNTCMQAKDTGGPKYKASAVTSRPPMRPNPPKW
jgi:hypothetical protein